jgi:class 3 adenylate cyclase
VSELPTGTVTLFMADVEDSTRLWESQPHEMTAAVARLDRTVCNIVATHGGVRPVEQGEGDSFVVAFARASDAVACALEVQRAALAPIRLRIGLHTGEVRLLRPQPCARGDASALPRSPSRLPQRRLRTAQQRRAHRVAVPPVPYRFA